MKRKMAFLLIVCCVSILALIFMPKMTGTADIEAMDEETWSTLLISRTGYCGDGVCNETESCITCPVDCGQCGTLDIPLEIEMLAMVIFILAIYLYIKFQVRAQKKT